MPQHGVPLLGPWALSLSDNIYLYSYIVCTNRPYGNRWRSGTMTANRVIKTYAQRNGIVRQVAGLIGRDNVMYSMVYNKTTIMITNNGRSTYIFRLWCVMRCVSPLGHTPHIPWQREMFWNESDWLGLVQHLRNHVQFWFNSCLCVSFSLCCASSIYSLTSLGVKSILNTTKNYLCAQKTIRRNDPDFLDDAQAAVLSEHIYYTITSDVCE